MTPIILMCMLIVSFMIIATVILALNDAADHDRLEEEVVDRLNEHAIIMGYDPMHITENELSIVVKDLTEQLKAENDTAHFGRVGKALRTIDASIERRIS